MPSLPSSLHRAAQSRDAHVFSQVTVQAYPSMLCS